MPFRDSVQGRSGIRFRDFVTLKGHGSGTFFPDLLHSKTRFALNRFPDRGGSGILTIAQGKIFLKELFFP